MICCHEKNVSSPGIPSMLRGSAFVVKSPGFVWETSNHRFPNYAYQNNLERYKYKYIYIYVYNNIKIVIIIRKKDTIITSNNSNNLNYYLSMYLSIDLSIYLDGPWSYVSSQDKIYYPAMFGDYQDLTAFT